MISKEFFQALKDLQAEKNISPEFFISALESGLTAAYKKIYGEAKSASVELNEEKCTIRIFSYKTVVETVEDPDKQISLEDAKLIKKSIQVGDTIKQEEDSKEFGRIPSQTVKHVIMQKLKEAVREQEHKILADKEGTIITAEIMRYEGGTYYLSMGGMEAEGVLFSKDQIPNERFNVGDRIKVYVRKVIETLTGLQIQVSRTNPNFVGKLFELNIPEIANKTIEIVSISREAGYRTKIAVKSNDPTLDPIGSCVGNKGIRVNAIVSELNGEKIDIIPYSENPAEYISNALSPAKTIYVDVNLDNKTSKAVVPDDKLSLAIGKDGQNVRLAARLTGWKIDVKSQSQDEKLNEEKTQEKTELAKVDDSEILSNIDEIKE
jgi:transcription termination/antitermination protein NusA